MLIPDIDSCKARLVEEGKWCCQKCMWLEEEALLEESDEEE